MPRKHLSILLIFLFLLAGEVAAARAHNPGVTLSPEARALAWVLLGGLALLLGGTAVRLILRPILAGYPAADTLLFQMQVSGWLVVGIASALAVLVQSAQYGLPITRVLFGTDLRAFTGWTFGAVWCASLLLWLLSGGLALRGAERGAALAAAVMALCVVLYSHAPNPDDTALYITLEWLHGLGLALLLGGLLVMWPLRRSAAVSARMWPYLSGLAWLVAATWLLVDFSSLPPGSAFASADASWLLARAGMFAPALIWVGIGVFRPAESGRLIRRGAALGLLIGGFIAGLIVQAAAPATPTEPSIGNMDTTIFYDVRQSAARVVDLTIEPGTPGANDFYVSVLDATSGARLDGLSLALSLIRPQPTAGAAPPLPLENSGDGIYMARGVALESAGTWQAVIAVEDAPPETFSFAPPIRAPLSGAGVSASPPFTLPPWGIVPLLAGVLALGGIGALLGRAFPAGTSTG